MTLDWPPPDAPLEHLEDQVAVVFLAPAIEHYLHERSSDAEHEAAAAFIDHEREAFDGLQTAINSTLMESLGTGFNEPIRLQHGYRRVPPWTGGAVSFHDAVVVLGQVDEIVQRLGGWIALGDLLWRLNKRSLGPWRRFAQNEHVATERAQTAFTINALKALCRRHAYREYGVLEVAVLECRHLTSPYVVGETVVGSEKHPLGPETNRIELILSERMLVYVTDSFGRCFEHYEIVNNKTRSLLPPRIIED